MFPVYVFGSHFQYIHLFIVGAYHQSMNAGLNIAEAVNYGDEFWMTMAGRYLDSQRITKCICKDRPHVNIGYQQILDSVLNGKKFVNFTFCLKWIKYRRYTCLTDD